MKEANILQEIWQKFTDVQEQMLNLRSVPVSVIPNSAKIVGEKLHLTADENDKTGKIINEIASTFKISSDEVNIEKGYFFVDADIAKNISKEDKKILSEKASANYIVFHQIPVIDGVISIKKDENKTITQFKRFMDDISIDCYHIRRSKDKNRYARIRISYKDLKHIVPVGLFNNCDIKLSSKAIFKLESQLYPKEIFSVFRKIKYLNWQQDENIFEVEFDWKTENPSNVIHSLKKIYPEFNILPYDENVVCNIRYKPFNNQNVNFLNEISSILTNSFPSIQLYDNTEKGYIYFRQFYFEKNQIYRLKEAINNELLEIDSSIISYKFYEIPDNKEKYIFEIDLQSKKESQASAVKELRGYKFCVGESEFGKLLKVKYPQMIFDISGDNFETTKQIFESHAVCSIAPNLTGDLEKIHRLKSSLNNILYGKNLQNPNLKDFIFDATKAKPVDFLNLNLTKELACSDMDDFKKHILNKQINEPQIDAIIKTLLAEDLALIQGPPGTGKSTAIAEIIWQHIRRNPNERILLTSETNLAVDNAINRTVNRNHNLVKPIRIGDEEKLEMEGRQFSIDVMKRWVENVSVENDAEEKTEDEESLPQKLILQNWIDNIRRRIKKSELDDTVFILWNSFLSNPSKQTRKIFYDNYVKNCNVVGATCSSIGQTNTQGKWTNFYWGFQEIFGQRKKLEFSTVIQDESSKATPAELSLPLIYGKKNIIIGDHRQLPPMLDKEEFKLSLDFLLDRTENKEDKKRIKELKDFVIKRFDEMEKSHFERLFEKIDDSLKGVFNLQYRMHPDINDVIRQFYVRDGGLECGLITPIDLGVNDPDMKNPVSRYHGIEIDGLMSKDNHTIWIDTNSPELLDGTSRTNYGEVEAIREILTKFRHSDSFKQYQSFWDNPEDQQIGLISFYGKQIKLLRDLRNEFRDIPIRVSTVDRFQGMERNIIIVSMVRSNRISADKKQKADINLYGELGFPEQKDLGFAQSPNRLNVALSRAKRLLIIVGNSELFRQYINPKTKEKIYDNVYRTIANNPNGKIIKYEVQ